jgi:hypothetical protein
MAANIFEYATREKLRFPFKGEISVEDLWDLSLTNLDKVYKSLNAQAKQNNEASLISSSVKTAEESRIDAKIEIVRYIFAVKDNEAKARRQEVEKAEKKQKIMSIIARKQDEALESMSAEDLQKMLDEL